jgi:hypothetical protein
VAHRSAVITRATIRVPRGRVRRSPSCRR